MEEPENQGNIPVDGMIGTVLGDRYELLSLIAAGGMGKVYRARHLVLDKIVAVKILHQDRSDDPTSHSRLVREGRTLSQLDHPNILKVLAFGISPDQRPYLVMDYLSGESLAQRIMRDGPLSNEAFRKIFLQILDGLAYAHKQGVVHRDLKPSNILICDDAVKIVDFGIAKLKDVEQSQKLTATDAPIGTALYMSPEQCMGKPIDERSDIYSLGCLMYEAVNGKPPFSGDTAYSVMHAHLTAEPTKESYAFAKVITRCLQKDPKSRYQSVEQLRSALLGSSSQKLVLMNPFRNAKTSTKVIYLAASLALVIATACMIGFIQTKPETSEAAMKNAAEYSRTINNLQDLLNREKHPSDHPYSAKEVDRLEGLIKNEIAQAEQYILANPGAAGSEQLAELLARHYLSSRRVEDAVRICNLVLDHPNRAPMHKESEAKLMRYRAQSLSVLQRYDEGLSAYKKTIRFLRENSSSEWSKNILSDVYLEMAAVAICREDLKDAEHWYNEALQYGRTIGANSQQAVKAEVLYCTFVRNQGDFARASTLADQAYHHYLSALRSGTLLQGLGATVMVGSLQSAVYRRDTNAVQRSWDDVKTAAERNHVKLDIEPNFLLTRQGEAYHHLGKPNESRRCFEKVVNSKMDNLNHAGACISLSTLEIEGNNYQGAIGWLNEGMKRARNKPDKAAVYFHYGICFTHFKKLAEMEALSGKAHAAITDSTMYLQDVGNIEASKNNDMLAILWECYLGNLYWRNKMPDQALQHYRAGIQRSRQWGRMPKHLVGDTLQDMARICYEQKLWQESASTYEELLTYIDHDKFNRWRNTFALADSYQHLNQYDYALPMFLKSEKLLTQEAADQPPRIQVWERIGSCYWSLSELDKSAEYYERAAVLSQKIGNKDFADRCLAALKKISNSKRDALSSSSK